MKKYRPITPSLRFKTTDDFKDLSKRAVVVKSLLEFIPASGGRNAHGHITSRHIGGGHKRLYRKIDFKRNKLEIPGKVASIEYDPNRSARVALIHYLDGEKRYIVAPHGLSAGNQVVSSNKEVEINPGNALLIKNIPTGTNLYNIELKPGFGGQMVRSAGCLAQLMAKEGRYALIKLPSGEVRKVLVECRATIGQVSNLEHENLTVGKAGRTRWSGRRPQSRGTAMNPVDHPHGGGHGKDHGGRHPVSPWGQPTQGYKTRNNKRTDKFIVQDRRT